MSETVSNTGQCLCGAVSFTARMMSQHVGACHCAMCRAWGGGPFLAVECGSDVEFSGEQSVSVFDSSDWAERGFCARCGSHLFYRLKDGGQYFIPVGLFEQQQGFVFDHQVFIDKKPGYYAFANRTKDMTEAEVFALYGAS